MTVDANRSGDGLRAALVGGWTLVRWSIEYPAAATSTEPFGADAEGLLVYTNDGWMSAAIQRHARAVFPLGPRGSTADQKSAAFSSYMHYAGRWRVDGRDVLHEISVAMHPGLVGTTMRRRAALAGDVLELLGDETLDAPGGVRRHRVVWKRAR